MQRKGILIFDEYGFARVCSALLESEGYEAEIVTSPEGLASIQSYQRFGLIITSYPFGEPLFEEIRKQGMSAIILSDDFDENLISMLRDINNSYCMMKPLDYEKFRALVKRVTSGESGTEGGYRFII